MIDNEEVMGILSNWNTVEAEIRTGLHQDFGQSKDLQDILDIIHGLQETANTVSPLRSILTKHIEDFENPHQISINLGDLDLLNTMYRLYTERFGIDMNIVDFGTALISIKRFATREDVDLGINKSSVVNVDVMGYLISKHNDSLDAHKDLFRHKLPGSPIIPPPSVVFDPSEAMNTIFDVVRGTGIMYHDINGRVKMAPVNTVPVDYLFGKPSVAIFSGHNNILLQSETLGYVTTYGCGRSGGSDLFIITPVDKLLFLLLQEQANLGDHGFTDTIGQEITGINNYSIYVYPVERSKLQINIVNADDVVIGTAVFDCDSVTSKEESNDVESFFSSIYSLPNGWFKCFISFDATGKNITEFKVNTLDTIKDDIKDASYQGRVCNSMAFWQHQLSKGLLPPPPIITEDEVIAVDATRITKDFTNQFNPIHGSFVFRYVSPLAEISGIESAFLRIGDDGDFKQTSLEINSNPIMPSRTRITTYNMDHDVLEIIDSMPYDTDPLNLIKRISFTYGLGLHGFAFTDQAPRVYTTGLSDISEMMLLFFRDIYDGTGPYTDVKFAQLPSMIITENDNEETIKTGSDTNSSTYRINMDSDVLELGHNSNSGLYLEGYLLNFRYYPVFASELNLEFLMDQFIPQS
jgi:hypothetical protein